MCDLSVIVDCVHHCADSCCERPFQLAHQKDKMWRRKRKRKASSMTGLTSLLLIFYLDFFPWIIADDLVRCRQCDKYTNLSEFPWNVGILKRYETGITMNMVTAFYRFLFYLKRKRIFLHIVNDINFHGYNEYIYFDMFFLIFNRKNWIRIDIEMAFSNYTEQGI